MSMIPAFHPHSEALMSNLASRAHEWSEWEISELLFELPLSSKSKGKRSPHFRILLTVKWVTTGIQTYTLTSKSSPTSILLGRSPVSKESLQAARILARRVKDSKGFYSGDEASEIDKFLTKTLT